MGSSYGQFCKYPRTPHLYGSIGTCDDKHLSEEASEQFLADDSLIVEEKIDGTNVGIHFDENCQMVLQCRGHIITEGMHPQYDLFKQWTICKLPILEDMLLDRYILFGEWMYARHSIHYRGLPHYFFEFDIYDKEDQVFLSLSRRLDVLEGSGIVTVPVIHRGAITKDQLSSLVTTSLFDSCFENPITNKADNLAEGLYLRTEADGIVTGRAKFVRHEFIEKVSQSNHWKRDPMVANELVEGANIWI